MPTNSTYDYAGGIGGCGLCVVSSGGTTTLANNAAVVLEALNVNPGNDADMLIAADTNQRTITVATTLPTDPTAAYIAYINAKQVAMYSGGVCRFSGTVQTFDYGYKIIADNCLTTLSGVTGSIELSGVNISFNPTTGFWVETYPSENNHVISIMRIKKPCGECGDYNALYMSEMILYHAINHVAWRIMRNVVIDYPPGLWRQYQGALYRWNAYTYSAQYVYDLDSTEDTFILKIGWINTTCTQIRGFAALAVITLDGYGETPEDYVKYRLLYGAKPRAEGCSPTIGFIANTDTQQVYLYSGTTADLGGLPLFSSYSTYDVVSSVQAFAVGDSGGAVNMNNWVVGVGGGNDSSGFVSGDGYGAIGVQLGFAQKITDDIEVSNDSSYAWVYAVQRHYEVYKGDAGTSETYIPPEIGSATINGIDNYTS